MTKQSNEKTKQAAAPKQADKGAKAQKAAKAALEEVQGEIMPGAIETAADVPILRRKGDVVSLDMIEASIRRDILIAARLDKASAMVCIKIGLALDAAKKMLRSGAYGQWVGYKFGEEFGMRKAQYFQKLAVAFMAENQARIALPSPQETGNWLAVRDEGSDLAQAVGDFVGDLSVSELMVKHKIKVGKKAGGFNPSSTMLNRYYQDHPEMAKIPVAEWTAEQRRAYQAWADEHSGGDSAEAREMAAEGAWHAIRQSLEEHGMSRASWKFLSHKSLQDVAEVLKEVLADIQKALKAIEKSK